MDQKTYVFTGTYTCPIRFGTGQILEGKGKGIYVLELDMSNGELKLLHVVEDVANPSFLVLNDDRGFLYAVNELKEFKGSPSGSVSSFSVAKEDGRLKFLNARATGGTDPCHAELDPQGAHLYVSNFMSGSICAYGLSEDGLISEPIQFIQHTGSSVNPKRQAGPHAHSLVFSPDGRYALVPDLGLDKLMVYSTDPVTGMLASAKESYFAARPGAGPRHCAFSNDGKYCYLINELECTILVLSYSAEEGKLVQLQSVSSLPAGVDMPGNTCADVHITPGGAFLYGSNRGHDSIIIYRIEKESGLLSYAGCQPSGGRTPRNFSIDPSGRFLICANQDSDLIAVFETDPDTGGLTRRSEINIPTPVCVRAYIF